MPKQSAAAPDARAGTLLDPAEQQDEASIHAALRPQRLHDFDGQEQLKKNLKVFINAARNRGEPLDHSIFYGPPGLGKTTLARIVANEMGYGFRQTSAPSIARAGDLAAILTSMEPWQVLFIDEIHRLSIQAEEILYSAMEDFRIDLVVGEGMEAKTISLNLPPFSLVGATTRPSALSGPLRDRFGIQLKLEYYSAAELETILARAAATRGEAIEAPALNEIARRSRGTPRIAHRIYRRVRDFAHQEKDLRSITMADAREALDSLGIDDQGLDRQDRSYLKVIAEFYGGGPVGIETIAASLNENPEVFETMVEPFLLNRGMIQRTPRGRVLAPLGYQAIGLTPPGGEEEPIPSMTLDIAQPHFDFDS